MGAYSLGIVLDFVVSFTSTDLMRALIVYNMYTHTHAYIHTHNTHMNTCMHTHIQQNTHNACKHTHASMHIYIHHTHTHIHTYILTCIQRHAYMYAYTCTCMQTLSLTCIHMYPQPYCLSKHKVNCLQVPGPIFVSSGTGMNINSLLFDLMEIHVIGQNSMMASYFAKQVLQPYVLGQGTSGVKVTDESALMRFK